MVLLAENAYEDGCLILRRCREHQSVLRQPGSPHDAAGAGDRRGDNGRKTACWIDKGRGDEAVSDEMAVPSILMMTRTAPNFPSACYRFGMRFNPMPVLTLWIALAVSIGTNATDSASATGQ